MLANLCIEGFLPSFSSCVHLKGFGRGEKERAAAAWEKEEEEE